MPLQVQCPKCGSLAMAGDNLAGLTTPCAVCGTSIYVAAPAAPTRGSGGIVAVVLAVVLGVLLLCGGGVGLVGFLVFTASRQAVEAQQRAIDAESQAMERAIQAEMDATRAELESQVDAQRVDTQRALDDAERKFQALESRIKEEEAKARPSEPGIP